MTTEERQLALSPTVPESIQYNAQALASLRSLTASLFGVAAGILGLESYPGFLFYLLGTLLVSILFYTFKAKGKSGDYFQHQWNDLWSKEVVGGLSSFVLTWTAFYGLVRA